MGRDFEATREQRDAQTTAFARTAPEAHGTGGLPAVALRMQRLAGNRATAALLRRAIQPAPSRILQRSPESAALLTELATPQIKTGPAVGTQKKLVEALNADGTFAGGILNLGAILIEEPLKSDADVFTKAQFVELPTAGGFISAGKPRSKELEDAGLSRLVLENTLKTMVDARQVEYLRKVGLPNDDWKILVEVHFYRERDMSATGMHKDTLSETLFVNLNYHMDRVVVGPEYVVNPPLSDEHEALIKTTLPASFQEDLAETRKKLGEPSEIGTGIVQPYGYVAFVDEAVHHATPYYFQRYITESDLTEFLGGNPIELLKAKYPKEFAAANIAYGKWLTRRTNWWSFYAFDDQKLISAADSDKWLAAMEIVNNPDLSKGERRYTRNDVALLVNDKEFDALLERIATHPEKGKARTSGAAGGFHAAQIPRPGKIGDPIVQPIKPTGKPPLKRRLSDADFRRKLPAYPGDKEKRAFFRSWVRVVPKEKVADLRKRLKKT